MKTYLVFEPADGGKNSETAENIVFLREKFSWPALFFTPVWLLWHRLWTGFLVWLAAVVAVAVLTQLAGLHPGATAIALWLPALIVAFEASELRRRKLVRNGFDDAGIVVAEDIEDAEQRFFDDWVKDADRRAPSPQSSPPVPPAPSAKGAVPARAVSAGSGVIGLFPQPGVKK